MNYKLLSLAAFIAATYALNNAFNKVETESKETLSIKEKSHTQDNQFSASAVQAIKEKLNKYKHNSLMKNKIFRGWLNQLGKAEYDINFDYSKFFRQYGPACRYHMAKSSFKRSIKKVGKKLTTINETDETRLAVNI